MKTTYFILLINILTIPLLHGQDLLHIGKSCSFDGEEQEGDQYVYDATDEAQKIVNEILVAAGSLNSKKFIIKESSTDNALAMRSNNQRYILYNSNFLKKFKADSKTRWAAYSVLAHEIGHHLNDDIFEGNTTERKQMELKADIFAGSVLRSLGCNEAEIDAVAANIGSIDETNSHPKRKARAHAIKVGWTQKDEQMRKAAANDVSEIATPPPSTTRKVEPARPEPIKAETSFNEVSKQNIVGLWYASLQQQGSALVVGIQFESNGTLTCSTMVDGVLYSTIQERWDIENGYLVEQEESGAISYNPIEWVDSNSFIYTSTSTNIVMTFYRYRE